jgi:hypothetical protein
MKKGDSMEKMRLKIKWATKGIVTVKVDEEYAVIMMDKDHPEHPRDLGDLPRRLQEKVMKKIQKTLFDEPIEIGNFASADLEDFEESMAEQDQVKEEEETLNESKVTAEQGHMQQQEAASTA